MRISEALSATREAEAHFANGAVLHFTYRPPSYTLEEADKLDAEVTATGGGEAARALRMTRLLNMISKLIVTWDLTDDKDVVINPQDTVALKKVPSNIFAEIVRAVNADNRPSGEAPAS